MTDIQGHHLDPTLAKTTVSHSGYKTEHSGWFLTTENVSAEGLRRRLQTGPHTLDQIERMLKPIQAADDPDLEDSVLARESVVERAFVRWIEDAATRLAERVTAGINGHKHEMNQSPLEKDDMIEEVINASARYEAWSRT